MTGLVCTWHALRCLLFSSIFRPFVYQPVLADVSDVVVVERRDENLNESVEEGLWKALPAAALSVGILGAEDLGLVAADVKSPGKR